jgi:hypothetical protein
LREELGIDKERFRERVDVLNVEALTVCES